MPLLAAAEDDSAFDDIVVSALTLLEWDGHIHDAGRREERSRGPEGGKCPSWKNLAGYSIT